MARHQGYFISFEGPEGSGKSTQIIKAASYLRKKGYSVLLLREPGGTRISEQIRHILLNKRFVEMTSETELLLYLAARSQIVKQKIQPALRKGKVVMCDRYEDSTLAYQGFGRQLPVRTIEQISRLVRGTAVPNRTFLLDIVPQKGFRRTGHRDRMENQSMVFHEKVRKGFLTLARKHRKRFVVLDATESRVSLAEKIRERLDRDLR